MRRARTVRGFAVYVWPALTSTERFWTKSRTETRPRFTDTLVPAAVSSVSQNVPRRIADARLPRVLKLPLPFAQSLLVLFAARAAWRELWKRPSNVSVVSARAFL